MMSSIKKIAIAGVFALIPLASNAATVDFDGLSSGTNVALGSTLEADDLRIVGGNCASGKCMALNKNENTKITSTAGTFTLESFWFQLLGDTAELTVTSSAGGAITFGTGVFGHNNGGQTFSLLGNALFEDVAWVNFDDTGKGNIRVDDLGLPAVVPLPAGGLLLMSALALLGLRRRS